MPDPTDARGTSEVPAVDLATPAPIASLSPSTVYFGRRITNGGPMSTVPCSSCGFENETGARFCTECGQSMDPHVHCPHCDHLQPVSVRFCSHCGAETASAGWQPGQAATGSVIEGVWDRDPEEFLRRVEPDEMRTFLGRRSLRVPPGTVGIALVDGVVADTTSFNAQIIESALPIYGK